MEHFVRRENIKHLREMLERTVDETERRRIQRLLDEELRKLKDAGDESSTRARA